MLATNDTIESLPSKIIEGVKGLFTSSDARIKEVEASNLKLTNDLAAKDKEIADLKVEMAKLKEKNSADLKAKEEEVVPRANAKATETLAKAGHTAVAAETPGPKATAKTSDELWAEFKTIQNSQGKKAARDFYLANKAAM